jgi:hypothetical protein
MPILMVKQQQQFSNLNFLESSETERPIDFTMSKFKSSSPSKHPHPLYHQFFGNNSNSDRQSDEQGK